MRRAKTPPSPLRCLENLRDKRRGFIIPYWIMETRCLEEEYTCTQICLCLIAVKTQELLERLLDNQRSYTHQSLELWGIPSHLHLQAYKGFSNFFKQ